MAATPHHSNVGHIAKTTRLQWLPHHAIPMWDTLIKPQNCTMAATSYHKTTRLYNGCHTSPFQCGAHCSNYRLQDCTMAATPHHSNVGYIDWSHIGCRSLNWQSLSACSSVDEGSIQFCQFCPADFYFSQAIQFFRLALGEFLQELYLALAPPPPPPSVNVHLPMQMEHNFSHKQQCNKLHAVMSFDKNLQSFQPQGNINMTSPNIHYYNYHCSAEDTHKKKCVQLGTHFYRMFLLGPHKLWFHSSGWGCDCWHHTLVLPSWGWCGRSVAMPVEWGDYLALQQTNKKPPSSSLSYTQHTHTHTQTSNNKTKQTKQQQPQNKHTNTHV